MATNILHFILQNMADIGMIFGPCVGYMF